MSKRKLTQNQTRRIQSNNAKALHRHKKKEVDNTIPINTPANSKTALLSAFEK